MNPLTALYLETKSAHLKRVASRGIPCFCPTCSRDTLVQKLLSKLITTRREVEGELVI